MGDTHWRPADSWLCDVTGHVDSDVRRQLVARCQLQLLRRSVTSFHVGIVHTARVTNRGGAGRGEGPGVRTPQPRPRPLVGIAQIRLVFWGGEGEVGESSAAWCVLMVGWNVWIFWKQYKPLTITLRKPTHKLYVLWKQAYRYSTCRKCVVCLPR